jgi:P-type Cu2+ transporter
LLKCDHCLRIFPEDEAHYHEHDGATRTFCCTGCLGVYLLINDEGLTAFYQNREWDDQGAFIQWEDEALDLTVFDETIKLDESTAELNAYVEGIRCAACVWLNEKVLGKTEGVIEARINYANNRIRLRWNPDLVSFDTIFKRVRSIGYEIKLYSESEHFLALKREKSDLLIRLGTAFFLSSQLMIYSIALYAGYFHGMQNSLQLTFQIIAGCLTLPVLVYSGMPIMLSALRHLVRFSFNMDSLILIGSGSAFIYSIYGIISGGEVYFDTAAMIVTLITLGRYIELSAKHSASETVDKLMSMIPPSATLVKLSESGEVVERIRTSVSLLKPGDLIEVKPGEKIAADGRVHQGESEVDESMITGESDPIHKTAGQRVTGGSINRFGIVIFTVTETGDKTILAGIIRSVEDAQGQRTRIQGFADRVIAYFVPTIILLSAACFTFYLYSGWELNRALMTAVSIMVIACPCSLGLATPLSLIIFSSRASTKGILIKRVSLAENVVKLKRVLFDKTGTITQGQQGLVKFETTVPSADPREVAQRIYSVELLSEHPIAAAVCTGLRHEFEDLRPVPVQALSAIPGRGITAEYESSLIVIGTRLFLEENGIADSLSQDFKDLVRENQSKGNTAILAGWDGKLQSVMILSDQIRPEAAAVVRRLKEFKLSVGMLSGDNQITSKAVAEQCDIDDVFAEMIPEKKAAIVSDYQQQKEYVMMVGDGINDAPALTTALVGVAMGRGTDIAMESADAILLKDDLELIPKLIKLSQITRRTIVQNVFWSFFYNVAAIPLAISGILHPIFAAGAMACSSLFVVINSLRIKRY